ncbi:SpoIID/LytB domain-containing protein [Nocardia exalbida]|uniref:SpoIID/LytB domain-containing protein n=1 Tax=Nocardia exalbida TaxID=290231 RepID=UPI001FE12460|nr:SpoIID/LytB domain-containing protein [Nocardia exalbida]
MSQVGAFENARAGWAAERILEHYYPGATLTTIAPTAVRVRLMTRDDSALDAFADTGLRVAGREVAPGQVAHLTPQPGGRASVVVTAGCDGDVLWQAATDDPWIRPVDSRPNRPAAEHLTLCGGSAYRGALGVALEDGAARTINQVDVEDYLLGVVPAEVQPNWADKGAAEALRAQAIAARSYALAEQRYPYAQTCDTTACQRYPGTAQEDPRTAAAVSATAGAVLLRDGRILRTEYSAAPDGGKPADIQTLEVGPAPGESTTTAPPGDPRKQVAVTESAIDAEYRRIGGATSTIGTPLGPEMILPRRAGTYRLYTNGVIIVTPTLGAQVVDYSRMLQAVPEAGEPSRIPPGASPGATAPGVVSPGAAQAGAIAPAGVDQPATASRGAQPGAVPPPGAQPGAIAPGGGSMSSPIAPRDPARSDATAPGDGIPPTATAPGGAAEADVVLPGGAAEADVVLPDGAAQADVALPGSAAHPGVASRGASGVAQSGAIAPGGGTPLGATSAQGGGA